MNQQPLEKFFREIFVADWLQSCNPAVLQRYMIAVDWFTIYFRAAPTIDDVSDETLTEFERWLIETNRADVGQGETNPARDVVSRLRQIRRYCLLKQTQCRRDMRLVDFLLKFYARDRKLTDHSIGTFRKAIRGISNFYGSEMMLSELTLAMVDGWQPSDTPRRRIPRECIMAMWRFAYELGYVATSPDSEPLMPAPLATAGDSLRLLMTSKYFPSKFSIQSDKTKCQYTFALNEFAALLGREPTIADLTDENVIAVMRLMLDRKLSKRTVNERRGRITALWKWLASKGYLSIFPTVERIPEPVASPEAWTQAELQRLFKACRELRGKVGNCTACQWMTTLHMVLWNCGERITAVLAIERNWINRETRQLHIPSTARKGGKKDGFYTLWPETIKAIDTLNAQHDEKLVFPFPGCESAFYYRYKTLLRRAGLPVGRKNGPHKMRRSFSTWLNVSGQDDTKALGHSNVAVTDRSYRDPRIIGAQPVELFKPWEA